MKISLSWLKSFVDIKSSPENLAEELTMTGLEVEAIEYPFDYIKDIITGKIEKISPHPNADKLQVCMVDTGEKELLKIVCGASNIYEGMVVPVALPGIKLPGGIKLKKSKIRGEESSGMLCSAKELDILDDSSGIMDLPKDIAPGKKLIEALELDDIVFEVALTPNRADCLSMTGIAREVAAIEGIELKIPESSKYNDERNSGAITERVSVIVKDEDLCPKYCARFIDNVKPGPSPWWIQKRLLCAGVRPLNNIVDVTNYVMLETGQPLHAFDFENLEDSKIIVQRADENESFVTLDGKKRTLDSEILMICDGQKKVAAAGIMGGLNSEITDKTKSVLLESAYFYPPSVRKSAKKLGLSTDSSHRFERGIDPSGVEASMNRAAELIEKTAGGKVIDGFIDTEKKPFVEKTIKLDVKKCCKRIGVSLSREEVSGYLESVAFKTKPLEDNFLEVKVPSFRIDVERPEDLSEEVARRFGYNNIKTTFPSSLISGAGNVHEFDLRLEIKDKMRAFGFNEVINYSFTGKSLLEKTGYSEEEILSSVQILNPISEEQSLMRIALLPGILSNISFNFSNQISDLKIFETGQIFEPDSSKDNLSSQKEFLCAAWTGKRRIQSWDDLSPDVDFYDIKGLAEGFFRDFNIDINFKKSEQALPFMRPGTETDIYSEENRIGCVFEVNHKILKNFNIEQPVFIFEIETGMVLQKRKAPFLSVDIPKFPSVSRDITILVPEKQPAGEIFDFFKNQNEKLLESVEFFDFYKGSPIPEGEKSLSFRLIYRAKDGNLKDRQINKVHEKLSSKLLKSFNIRFPS
ncbi:MAG: phenylalanine--tRNA ligase subunit beta [Deltaproteobacteria bacterium]|nr:MAG: phenylalanine--tRNA ligase subunit beta [Deltaproteobacteria bacterium]